MFANFFRNSLHYQNQTDNPSSAESSFHQRSAAKATIPQHSSQSDTMATTSHHHFQLPEQNPPLSYIDCTDDTICAMDNLANLALHGGMNRYSQRKVIPEDFILLKVIGKGSYGKC